MLCTQCSGIGPHIVARGKSHIFSRVSAENHSTFSIYGGDGHSNPVFVHYHQDSCLVTTDTSGISTTLGRAIRLLLEGSRETEFPFLVAPVILGFLSIFKKCQASSHFEALNSACLLRCQRDVRPSLQMRQRTRSFSKVSTGDSDIPSFIEMKDKAAFKPLQGNPGFL